MVVAGVKVNSPAKTSLQQPPVQPVPQQQAQAPKVVGPNVPGKREEYQLVRRLQSALFGGVYEAKGLSSGREFAIKVLHKSELSKAQEPSIEFCEVPLSEIRFAELMKGNPHVMEPEEHFEDQYCYYVVFELARGGDLLEALKQKPTGFDEAHAQNLMLQAAKGLAYLHSRKVAMQDVSLENMLLHVAENTGHYQVKVIDPGQAVVFERDQHGEEIPVQFGGLVGKSFRPPELHEQKPYLATKVDSWCLGWSTFYLLTAQPLFMSADPAQKDSDWLLFQQGDYKTLFQQKSNLCSHAGLDFIFRLLQIEPGRRMSIADALEHKWLKDPTVGPVLAPKELLPESLRLLNKRERELPDKATVIASSQPQLHSHHSASGNFVPPVTGVLAGQGEAIAPSGSPISECSTDNAALIGGDAAVNAPPPVPAVLGAGGEHRVSTGSLVWNASGMPARTSVSGVQTVRVSRSPGPGRQVVAGTVPVNTPRVTLIPGSEQVRGRVAQAQPGLAARSPYVIASAHSPPPTTAAMQAQQQLIQGQRVPPNTARGVQRGGSPAQSTTDIRGGSAVTLASQQQSQQQQQQGGLSTAASGMQGVSSDVPAQRPNFMTPRAQSRPKVSSLPSNTTTVHQHSTQLPAKADTQEDDEKASRPAWTFRASSPGDELHRSKGSEATLVSTPINTRCPSPASHSVVVPGAGSLAVPGSARGSMAVPVAGTSPAGSIAAPVTASGVRQMQSPVRGTPLHHLNRSQSPNQIAEPSGQVGGSCAVPVRHSHAMPMSARAQSPPGAALSPVRTSGLGGFSWSQAPVAVPYHVASNAAARAVSPQTVGGHPVSFAWSPDPPSPAGSPRTFAVPSGAITFRAAPVARR